MDREPGKEPGCFAHPGFPAEEIGDPREQGPFLVWVLHFLKWKCVLEEAKDHGDDTKAFQEKVVCFGAKVTSEPKLTEYLQTHSLENAYSACKTLMEAFKTRVTSASLSELTKLTTDMKEVALGKLKQGKWHDSIQNQTWQGVVEAAKKTLLVKSFANNLRSKQQELAEVRRSVERHWGEHRHCACAEIAPCQTGHIDMLALVWGETNGIRC